MCFFISYLYFFLLFLLFLFCFFFFFFFFSSRRRHTRLVSDWSSDVCSSDLGKRLHEILPTTSPRLHHGRARRHRNLPGGRRLPARCPTLLNEFAFVLPTAARARVFR